MALSGLTIDGVSVGRTNNLALGNIAYGVEELFGHGDGVGMIELDATERCRVVVLWCRGVVETVDIMAEMAFGGLR